MEFFNTEDLKDNEIYLKLDDTAKANIEQNWVQAYYFKICIFNSENEIGYCDLRVGHNELLYYGGNIGYNIEKDYRGNSYAAKACKLLFKLAKKHELGYLIITCNPDNYPSKRTCEKIGGVLETIADVPKYNPLYLRGEHKKCIYKFIL